MAVILDSSGLHIVAEEERPVECRGDDGGAESEPELVGDRLVGGDGGERWTLDPGTPGTPAKDERDAA